MGQLYYTTDAKKVKPETEFEKALEEAKKDAFNVQPKLETVPAPIKKKSIVERVKEEILHYWHGSKLLAAETKISSRLLLKVLKGNTLSRREYRQVLFC
jgi:LETM1 and EF-hand domain-containing protein 1